MYKCMRTLNSNKSLEQSENESFLPVTCQQLILSKEHTNTFSCMNTYTSERTAFFIEGQT